MTGTDAKEAMRHGVDAIIVSNHGGQRKKAGRRRLGAVGIGRPYVCGLASFGEAGVDRVLEIMDSEFVTIMRQVGALNIGQITRDNVTRAQNHIFQDVAEHSADRISLTSWLLLAAPTATERLEHGDLVLYQNGIRCSDRGVHRHQQLFRGQQVKTADGSCKELIVSHAVGCLHLVAGFVERLAIVERGTVQRERLLGLGLPYPSARSGHIWKRPAD